MKHVIRKPYWNYEKEEKWLNDMSAKGLAMCDYSWCRYVFEEAPKGEYIYRIELLEHKPAHPESQNYIRFLEDTGVEFVSSYMRWAYFRKKAASGPFDLYSDIDSKIRHLKRVVTLWTALACMEFLIGAMNLSVGISEWGTADMNFILSFILFAIGFGIITLILPIGRKIRQLKKEKKIRES